MAIALLDILIQLKVFHFLMISFFTMGHLMIILLYIQL